MHTLKLILGTTAASLALVAGGAGWAAQAWTSPTALPAEAVQVIAPVEKAQPPAPALHASCEYGVDTAVETIAWAEIARLEKLGFPVCDTIWSFGPIAEDGIWGQAWPAISSTDPRTLVVIELDEATYAGVELEEAVRTTVRHEYGHIITFASGDVTIDRAHEEAADALAEALTPAGEARTVFYAETITAAALTAAQDLTAVYTAQTA